MPVRSAQGKQRPARAGQLPTTSKARTQPLAAGSPTAAQRTFLHCTMTWANRHA